jgi:hypothetical protein
VHRRRSEHREMTPKVGTYIISSSYLHHMFSN